MIENYFKIAWRSLWRHKTYSVINIVGLSIGLTACLIVATVVFDELSYDHQWKKGDDIYRVLSINNNVKGDKPMPVAVAGFGPATKKDLPEVADYCRASVSSDRLQLGKDKQGVSFKRIFTEPSIWNVFDFKLIAGSKKFVKGYVNLIITNKIKQQYFASENPIGKIIYNQPEYGNSQPYLITGVIDNIPVNTHLRADYINIMEFGANDDRLPQAGEGYTFLPQYILLKKGTSIKQFTIKVNNWYAKQTSAKVADNSFSFQPIKDVYLKSDFNENQPVKGSITTVYIFSAVAALLLIIACINFVNLTVSRVFSRARETGIRKVLGAVNMQLIIRFLTESVMFFFISFILALLLYPILLKPVETYLGHQLVLNVYNEGFLIVAIGSVLLISFFTGLYPAWYLSRPKPIVIMKDKLSSGVQLNVLKKVLVVGQFVISVVVILAAIIVHNQLSFIDHKDLGFDKNNLLNVSYTSWGNSGAAFKQKIKEIPGVESVSISHWTPGGSGTMSSEVILPGQKQKTTVYYIEGDADLPATMGFKLESGRSFDSQISADTLNTDSAMGGTSAATKLRMKTRSLLATNYTAALLGLKMNKPIANLEGQTIGFVQDFNSESLHSKLQPTLIQAISDLKYGNMLIRIKPGFAKPVLINLSAQYKLFYPDRFFQYSWVNDEIDDQYKSEYKLQQLFTCFSILIVFLACLGLLGLVSFTAEQRVKEIGIRKVLGATVTNILVLISQDYLWLVVSAIFIASPIAWYAMNKWLQSFAYRIGIQWWVFVLTGVMSIIIALITIGFQSVKAAIANPVKSLRSE